MDNPAIEEITPFYSVKKDDGKLQIVSPLQHALGNNAQVIKFDSFQFFNTVENCFVKFSLINSNVFKSKGYLDFL